MKHFFLTSLILTIFLINSSQAVTITCPNLISGTEAGIIKDNDIKWQLELVGEGKYHKNMKISQNLEWTTASDDDYFLYKIINGQPECEYINHKGQISLKPHDGFPIGAYHCTDGVYKDADHRGAALYCNTNSFTKQ